MTFDEWYKEKNGQSFDAAYPKTPGTPIKEHFEALSRELRDYASEVCSGR